MPSLPAIQTDLLIERMVELLKTPSPTGDTDDALSLVARWLAEMGLEPFFTKKGALTVTVDGESDDAPRAVTGHVDTLGGIITRIKPDGRLTFDRIGGYPYFAVNGEYCWVRTAAGGALTGTALLVKSSVHVHREQPVVLDGPVAFRVEIGVEALVVLIQYLVGLELVEPQQPVGLIEPVFPQERRLRVQRRQAGVIRHRDIS